ncbi:MAG TPA: phosphoglucosamine mutase [Solirubrobacterales bacterium]|nr:phosphoglucosamine mutase [Solirubrobacterales bacterium]
MGEATKLFGTDGVRGPVGETLTPELALSLGRATAAEISAERPQVLIIRDTRESGHMLESALASGLAASGADVFLGGVLPTPAAAILVRRHGMNLAAVVSASHNPWRDNGIKFFDSAGRKLDDAAERRVEARVAVGPELSRASGRIRKLEGARDDYLRELAGCFDLDLAGRRIVLDCANGATYRVAPAAFERLGAEVISTATEPDGRNINEGCGSTHLGHIGELVRREGAELGFAFDGDGDRVLAVDGDGEPFDGDEIVALAALHLKDAGELAGGAAVTVMTNYGFHTAMSEAGVEVATTKVGDRYVIEELLERGWTIGGEQSGHIIWTDFAATGDGLAAALLVTRALGDRTLAAARPIEKLPQYLENVKIPSREALAAATGLWEAVGREGARLEGRGRVLVRPSGTEPLIRVMVEGPDRDECEDVLRLLVEAAERALS